MFFSRFHLVVGVAAAIVVVAALAGQPARAEESPSEPILRSADTRAAVKHPFTAEDSQLLDAVERGCFNCLWREVGVPAPLAKDRRTTLTASVAGVGFQLSALPIGVARGWITRREGEERALGILHALLDRTDNRRLGVFLHFVSADTGGVYPPFHNEVSTVDHALLLAGALPAASYFGGEVADLVRRAAAETNWQAYVDERGFISFGWQPVDDANLAGDGKMAENEWHLASSEEQVIYFMAVGCPTEKYAVDPAQYYKLERHVDRHADMAPYVVSWNGALFTYFFSHCWIDYRSLDADDPSKFGSDAPRVDWFENSCRAVLTHRQRCIEAAGQFPTFAPDRWGLSPCMGFDNRGVNYLVQDVRPNLSRHDDFQNGTVAPYAAGSAIMFAPAESVAALRAFRDLKDKSGAPLVWRDPAKGGYGLADSFHLHPDQACDDNVSIDVGPMLLAIENARTGLIWRLFMQHEIAKRAVQRLGLIANR